MIIVSAKRSSLCVSFCGTRDSSIFVGDIMEVGRLSADILNTFCSFNNLSTMRGLRKGKVKERQAVDTQRREVTSSHSGRKDGVGPPLVCQDFTGPFRCGEKIHHGANLKRATIQQFNLLFFEAKFAIGTVSLTLRGFT